MRIRADQKRTGGASEAIRFSPVIVPHGDFGTSKTLRSTKKEFRPGWPRAPRRGSETAAVQDIADRHRRYVVAELEELATDALVAPPRVVGGEPDDQFFDLWWNGRSSSALAPPARRLARDQVTMPPEQRLGADDER